MENVLVLITGGTIDNVDYRHEEDDPKRQTSIIPDMLQNMRADVASRIVFIKDSSFVTTNDRQILLHAIESSNAPRIIVTHGTNTMPETAKFLGPHVKNKTVVLTGCMTLPLQDQGKDARIQLDFALQQAHTLPPGVYIAIENRVFNWDNVRKNFEARRFETEKEEDSRI